jgi:hypothetical protein
VRPGGAVAHAGLAELAVALCPAPGGGDGDLEAFGGAAQRPAILDDTAGQAQTPEFGQRRVTVGHEGLSGWRVDVAIHTEPEALTHSQDHRVRVVSVPNLCAQYS